MELKTVISVLSVLGLLSGTTTVLAAKPGTYIHRAANGYVSTPSSGTNKSMEECTQISVRATIDSIADSEEASAKGEKCKASRGNKQKHNHRKMKNL